MTEFHQITPTLDNKWRSIVLFGRNVASYKFALASALLELSQNNAEQVSLDALATPFATHVCNHLKFADKQATSASSRFLDECRAFNRGDIDQDRLITKTVQLGFNNVIDAFHVVNGAEVGTRFFIDERKGNGGIRLTQELMQLRADQQAPSLATEVEARWRLVETAWEMGVASYLIQPDATQTELFIPGPRRRTVTSCRGALNGYQKGHCFYCFRPIFLNGDAALSPDVDHFFPWILEKEGHVPGLNGVWNLVLACRTCNRGSAGKFARVPSLALVERLHKRNNYLIDSHHPLRETLMIQTGRTPQERQEFIQKHLDVATSLLGETWCPQPQAAARF